MHLLLVIDRALHDGLTKNHVRRKLNVYEAYVKSGTLEKSMPQAKPAAGVYVHMYYRSKANALGKQVLEQIAGYAKDRNMRPVIRELQEQEPMPKEWHRLALNDEGGARKRLTRLASLFPPPS